MKGIDRMRRDLARRVGRSAWAATALALLAWPGGSEIHAAATAAAPAAAAGRAAPATGHEAAAPPAAVPRTIEGELRPGDTRRTTFNAGAGNLVYGSFQADRTFVATLTGPDGQVLRTLAPGLVSFVAPRAGEYKVDLSSKGGAGSYQLTLSVATPVNAAGSSGPDLLSARLRAQSRAIAEGRTDTGPFWAAVAAEGTPLIERVGDDYLVTLLWRGDAATQTVKVSWPFFHIAPVVELRRLGQSDIWFRSFRFAPGTRFNYRMFPDPPRVEGPPLVQALAMTAVAQNDPLNRAFNGGAGAEPGAAWSQVELPPRTPPSPWATVRPDVAKGQVASFEFESATLGNRRRISVYTPAGYRPACGPYRLVVLFDGAAYQSLIPVPVILDNLIAAREIAPTIAVFVDNVSIEGRAAELYPNAGFTTFVATELMGRIRRQYAVTRDPKQVVLGGFSLGGLAATHIAWRRPETFGAVLSQSGAFWWSSEAIRAGRGEPILTEGPLLDPHVESFELVRMIARAPAAPIRLHLEAGVYEGDLLTGNRFLRDVLTAKSYDFGYREFPGGHDGSFWRESFADALRSLVGKAALPLPARCPADAARHRRAGAGE